MVGDILIYIISALVFLFGILGCFLPIIPGPPLAFISVLLIEFFTDYTFGSNIYFIAILVILVTFLDYYIQIKGVKFFGGGKKSTTGAIIGLIIGIFFSPFSAFLSILLGPFIGAFIGALSETDEDVWKSLRIASGALLGFVTGVIFKLCVCIYIVCYFFKNII